MSGSKTLDILLNPGDPGSSSIPVHRNIAPLLRSLAEHIDAYNVLLAPSSLYQPLEQFLTSLNHSSPPPTCTTLSADNSTCNPNDLPYSSRILSPPRAALSYSPETPLLTRENIYLNRKTMLARLHIYDTVGAYVEYPESICSDGSAIGYLFRLDPNDWCNPMLNFAYSLGEPSGRTKKGNETLVDLHLLRFGETSGNGSIPCVKVHKTCQGSKICPLADEDLVEPHVAATREDILQRLLRDRENRLEIASPTADVFQRTSAFISALGRLGCRANIDDSLAASSILARVQRYQQPEDMHERLKVLQRGYIDKVARCPGKVMFTYDDYEKPLLVCENYNPEDNRNHYIQYLDASLDIDYIEAIFTEDRTEAQRIEESALSLGYGPLAECTTVTNVSAKRVNCPFAHRDENGHLYQPEMKRISCDVRFSLYEPLEEFRISCPYVLVTIKGIHKHPIPLPQRTPPSLRAELFDTFKRISDDIPDLTVRRFLRHPVVKSMLQQRFPNDPFAALSDVHVSLANRAHLRTYIQQARKAMFPEGTGWAGALNLYHMQNEHYPVEAHYIRAILELDASNFSTHIEDEADLSSDGSPLLKIIVCMSQEGSRRLLKAQYLQSDISFKRVVGYREFALACFLNDCFPFNILLGVVFCRVFLNRETAVAHQHVFSEIEKFVKQDTGESLSWRHLHASMIDDYDHGILQWTADAHKGQAKGLGLHLQTLAQKMPDTYDLHEPDRLLCDLTPYDHLHRVFRLCEVHIRRNIHSSSVPENVRNAMRSLICLEHPNWDRTLDFICAEGGDVGYQWIKNKVDSHFMLEAMCWELSFIPLDIWMSGEANDNLVESTHFNINLEGKSCTLVGGIETGRRFDSTKMATLRVGINSSELSCHLLI
ncbi:hypothetical protein EDD18DRAFT_1093925 [Armillaria luteobubalina]|uniref:Uncharacterized protein n=1 Tax=Armillaria luteobubalina TaxID=153913 RepID=A0AA39NW90_9AGAR|nr:hypothetical protein EDD18DRAFT_1093925 [Armillaria luteobubalina]